MLPTFYVLHQIVQPSKDRKFSLTAVQPRFQTTSLTGGTSTTAMCWRTMTVDYLCTLMVHWWSHLCTRRTWAGTPVALVTGWGRTQRQLHSSMLPVRKWRNLTFITIYTFVNFFSTVVNWFNNWFDFQSNWG